MINQWATRSRATVYPPVTNKEDWTEYIAILQKLNPTEGVNVTTSGDGCYIHMDVHAATTKDAKELALKHIRRAFYNTREQGLINFVRMTAVSED